MCSSKINYHYIRYCIHVDHGNNDISFTSWLYSFINLLRLKGKVVMSNINEVKIIQTRGHWEVYVNSEFFCSADSYIEAVNELYETHC